MSRECHRVEVTVQTKEKKYSQLEVKSFSPISTKRAKVLILGSMPGLESLRLNQYYAHPRNAFWYIMGDICGFSPELSYVERVKLLGVFCIAVWDVLHYAKREGSLDSAIDESTEIPNDFDWFLSTHGSIKGIFFNGKKSAKAFDKHVKPDLSAHYLNQLTFTMLPSTSPANTRMSREEKLTKWREIERYLS